MDLPWWDFDDGFMELKMYIKSQGKLWKLNICIKYLMQHGLIPLPKASSVEHIKENLNLDFTISESDMKKLDNIKDVDYEEYKVFPVFSNK